MKVEISAPGKVFLSGEYLVVDGALATILSTRQRAKVIIEDNSQTENVLYSSPIDRNFPFLVDDNYCIKWIDNNPNQFGSLISYLFQEIKIKPKSTRFSLDTSGFFYQNKKIGIGSSAALSVALVNAVNIYYNMELSHTRVLELSLKIHAISQQNLGSGLDVLAAFADSKLIECDHKMLQANYWKEMKWPANLFIKGVITNHQGSTSKMIERYSLARDNNQTIFKKLLLESQNILKQLSSSWKSRDVNLILDLMTEYNLLIRQMNQEFDLGIYTKEHQILFDLALNSKLLYKPSGAGGGDLGFILSTNKKQLEKFTNILKDSNFQTIDLR